MGLGLQDVAKQLNWELYRGDGGPIKMGCEVDGHRGMYNVTMESDRNDSAVTHVDVRNQGFRVLTGRISGMQNAICGLCWGIAFYDNGGGNTLDLGDCVGMARAEKYSQDLAGSGFAFS